MGTPRSLALPVTDRTFAELRAALRALDDPAAVRSEGQRGVADCLEQLKRDVRQVKQAFARRLDLLQRATAPRFVAVPADSVKSDDRFQSRLFDAQAERERERDRLQRCAAALQRVLARNVTGRRVVVVSRPIPAPSVAGDQQHRYPQSEAALALCQQENHALRAALQRFMDRDDARTRFMREQRDLIGALHDAAVAATGRAQAAEHRVRRLQSDLAAVQSQLDQRDDADDEAEATRARVSELERALAHSERRLRHEHRESEQLRRAQVRSERRSDWPSGARPRGR